MKQSALQALQHIRTTLAHQLTPEAIEGLVGPIQRALEPDPFNPVQPVLTQPHNAKVREVEAMARTTCSTGDLCAAIRSLRL